jgi:hypothetical protein
LSQKNEEHKKKKKKKQKTQNENWILFRCSLGAAHATFLQETAVEGRVHVVNHFLFVPFCCRCGVEEREYFFAFLFFVFSCLGLRAFALPTTFFFFSLALSAVCSFSPPQAQAQPCVPFSVRLAISSRFLLSPLLNVSKSEKGGLQETACDSPRFER